MSFGNVVYSGRCSKFLQVIIQSRLSHLESLKVQNLFAFIANIGVTVGGTIESLSVVCDSVLGFVCCVRELSSSRQNLVGPPHDPKAQSLEHEV